MGTRCAGGVLQFAVSLQNYYGPWPACSRTAALLKDIETQFGCFVALAWHRRPYQDTNFEVPTRGAFTLDIDYSPVQLMLVKSKGQPGSEEARPSC